MGRAPPIRWWPAGCWSRWPTASTPWARRRRSSTPWRSTRPRSPRTPGSAGSGCRRPRTSARRTVAALRVVELPFTTLSTCSCTRPSESNFATSRYSELATLRAPNCRKTPPPVGALSIDAFRVMSTSAAVGAPMVADGPAPGVAILIVPTPPPTAKLALPPSTVQAPPVSAEPHPPVVVREKVSLINAAGAGALTVTGWVTELVAPASSVTVRVTW